MAVTSTARAHFIELGQITFTGTFASVNFQNGNPFGYFTSPVTATQVNGIFSQYVYTGEMLAMSSPNISDYPPFPIYSIGGFTLENIYVQVVGPDFAPLVVGLALISGNGYVPSPAALARWDFHAPAVGQEGLITANLIFGYENGVVPDTGSTVSFLSFGLIGLAGLRRYTSARRLSRFATARDP